MGAEMQENGGRGGICCFPWGGPPPLRRVGGHGDLLSTLTHNCLSVPASRAQLWSRPSQDGVSLMGPILQVWGDNGRWHEGYDWKWTLCGTANVLLGLSMATAGGDSL